MHEDSRERVEEKDTIWETRVRPVALGRAADTPQVGKPLWSNRERSKSARGAAVTRVWQDGNRYDVEARNWRGSSHERPSLPSVTRYGLPTQQRCRAHVWAKLYMYSFIKFIDIRGISQPSVYDVRARGDKVAEKPGRWTYLETRQHRCASADQARENK